MIEHLYTMILVITINLKICFEKPFFYVVINPTCSRCILHILHGHVLGIHVLSLNLEALRDSDYFILLGTKFHVFGPT